MRNDLIVGLFVVLLIITPQLKADECSESWMTTYTNLYYKFEETAKPYIDVLGNLNLTVAPKPPARISGKINYGQDFEDDYGNYTNSTTSTILQEGQFSWNFWFYPESLPATSVPISYRYQSGTTVYGAYFSIYSTGYIDAILYKGSGSTNVRATSTGTIKIIAGRWQMITFTYDGNQADIYVNGTEVSYATHTTGAIAYSANHHRLNIGSYVDAGYDTDGIIDEVSFWSDDLNQTCINYLYNSNNPTAGQQYPYPKSVVTSLAYPTNNSHMNYYNGSIILTSTVTAKCSLNDTNWTATNTQPNTTFKFMNSKTLSERPYSVRFNCSESVLGSTDNGTINFVIDRTYPDIFQVAPSNATKWRKNFTMKINFYDIYLYAGNVTIKNSSDFIVYNKANISSSGTWTWWNFSKAINLYNGSYPDGNYTIIMQGADTHTDRIFDEAVDISTKSDLAVDTKPLALFDVTTSKEGEDILIPSEKEFMREKEETVMDIGLKYADITMSCPIDITLSTDRLIDRITFTYETDNLGIKYCILSGDKLVYLKESPFTGHMIINDKYWFDVEGLKGVELKKIDDQHYIYFWEQTEKSITSQSLGGLNQQNKTGFFEVDKTKPTINNNVTTVMGNGVKFFVNLSEPVTYNMSVLTNCSGSIIKTQSNASSTDLHTIRVYHLSTNTSYSARFNFMDEVYNNNSICYNFTTGLYELEVINTAYSISESGLNFSAIGFDYGYHPFGFNWSFYRNGIKILESDHSNYLNVTNEYFAYKTTAVPDYYATYMNGTGCYNLNESEWQFRLRSDYSGAIADRSVTGFCYNGTAWEQLFNLSGHYNIYDTWLNQDLDNGSSVWRYLNYTAYGTWINVSPIVDNNISTYSSCTSGFDDCWIHFTYHRYFDKEYYYNNISYRLFGITNMSTGRYYTLVNIFDGNHTSITLNVSLNITFVADLYNEQTGKLIDNVTANITFISDEPGFVANKHYTTNNGHFQIDDLFYTDYNIIYSAPGFEQRHYYLARSDLNLNGTLSLFLLTQEAGDFAIIRVLDQNLNPVEGAIVRVMKNIPNFDERQIISILEQNSEGESTLDFVFNTDDYQFVVLVGGVIVKTTSLTQVSKSILNIQIELGEDELTSLRAYSSAYTSDVTILNGTTSDKVCSFLFTASNIRYGCLRVYARNLMENDILVCESCLNASAGFLNCAFNISEHNLYICQGIVDTNSTSSEYVIDEDYYSSTSGRNILGLLGVFLSFIVIFGLAFAFREHPAAMVLTLNIGVVITILAGFVSIPFGGVIMIMLLGGYFIMRWEQ